MNKKEKIDEECSCKGRLGDCILEMKDNFPKDETLYDLADFFKVLGDSTRVKILYALSITEMCVCDLASTLDMTGSAISHQLRVLKQTKLVKPRREGKTIYYSLDDNHIVQVFNQGLEHIRE